MQEFYERGDKRILLGAVAGGTVHNNALYYAIRQGRYIITQSGESAVLSELPDGFEVREW